MKLFTPLISYIISILKQEQENMDKHLIINLKFTKHEGSVELDDVFKVNDDNVVKTIRDSIRETLDVGYYMKFTYSFHVQFLLKDNCFLNEDKLDNEDNHPFIDILNNTQTFESDKCVVSIDSEPNILMCNCGHICLCERCLLAVSETYECPICKCRNTILRVIKTVEYNIE